MRPLLFALSILIISMLPGGAAAADGQLLMIYPHRGIVVTGQAAWIQFKAFGTLQGLKAKIDGEPLLLEGPPDSGSYWSSLEGLEEGLHKITATATGEDGSSQSFQWELRAVAPFDPELNRIAEGLTQRLFQAQAQFDSMLETGEFWRRWQEESERLGSQRSTRLPVNPLAYAALAEDLPDGYFASGAERYAEIRGRRYFAGEFHSFWGPSTYEPEREIAAWPRFLEEYSQHPGADDAAYRLARSYELIGDNLDALKWLLRAVELPDGDMHVDAYTRLLYLLDVVMSKEELKALAASPSSELHALQWPAVYTLGLRSLRDGALKVAATQLAQAAASFPIAAYPEVLQFFPNIPFDGDQTTDRVEALRDRVKAQANLVGEMAELERIGAEDAAAAYQLAALAYNTPLLYYNHLWGGLRNSAWLSGYVQSATQTGRGQEQMKRFLRVQNNYWHAYSYFSMLTEAVGASPDLLEKAEFSAAMSLYRLALHSEEVYLWKDPEALRDELVAAFRTFALRHPASSLADDALLMVGVYGQDRATLDNLVSAYPEGDKRPIAESLLASWGDNHQFATDPLLKRLPAQDR